MARKQGPSKAGTRPECFVIMPISEIDGYKPGHFNHVFNDILAPACSEAGYDPVRVDQVRQTNLIHLDILQRLIDSPMVLCDLSSRNPNVLFELGLRQAFDKPVVLVQEKGTPKIFDIAPLRYTEYRSGLVYHEVVEDRSAIARAIEATAEAFAKGAGINSMVRILSVTQPPTLAEVQEANQDPALQILRAELKNLFDEVRSISKRLPSKEAEFGVTEANSLSYDLKLMERSLSRMVNANRADPNFKERVDRAREQLEDGTARYRQSELWIKLAIRLSKLESAYEKLARRSLSG